MTMMAVMMVMIARVQGQSLPTMGYYTNAECVIMRYWKRVTKDHRTLAAYAKKDYMTYVIRVLGNPTAYVSSVMLLETTE